ncbi:MAG: hypothetical protein NTY86_02260 [Deltaproteobacteria bacterium]|nr:hypothetical protein [Deltaproteobacteria bacterium]
MSLQKWLEYGWLRSHKTSRKEISDLLRITDRDLLDAAGDISAGWRFGDTKTLQVMPDRQDPSCLIEKCYRRGRYFG